MKIEVLHNPIAGAGRAGAAARNVVQACSEAGHDVQLRETVQDSTETANADQACDLLIVVGGDGTIRLAAREAIARDIPIYHYPFGTENLFARQFEMDRSTDTLLRALHHGNLRRVDVARVNGELLTLMLSVGFDAAVVADLAEHRRGAIRHSSYVLPTLRQLWAWRPPRCTAIVDGRPLVEDAVGTIIVANSPEYALRFNPARGASIEDGELDVVFFPLRSRFGLLPWAWRTWRGRHLLHPAIVTGRGRRVEVVADPPSAYQLDGDAAVGRDRRTALKTPLVVEIDPARLQVLTPGAR